MGNSESQYSIEVPKATSFTFPRKQKPYSLKLRSAKEDVLSPHMWWKNTPIGSRYRSSCGGRGCLSPPKSYHAAKGTRGSQSEQRSHRSPGCVIRRRHMSDDYDGNPYGAELNGHALNGHSDEVLKEQNSPRVVIRKDGTLRVEFTNSSGNPLLLDATSGPVQLLKFSPNLETTSTPSLPGSRGSRQDDHCGGPPPASTSSTARTSKGSSLSSEGSWYDSPWGPSTELCEQEKPCSTSRTLAHSPTQHGSFAEQPTLVSITDLYKDSAMAATFPTARDLSSQIQESPPGRRRHRASLASVLDVPFEEECAESPRYLSYTLPCRRPKAHTIIDFGFNKKDSLRNRIRRFSDWTGSLSRKKKKLQDTRYKDTNDAFDSGVDGLTADTSSPSQVSSLLWFPGACRTQSSGALHQTTSDAVRQNIYENFMRELETGAGHGGGERRDPSTEDGESSSESAEGSLEQLDLLFEKEQGVVRRAGWLSFKPLVTLHKDRKLELVTRRRWKQYWVTLKGCTLLFYETYSKGSPEQELSPRYALLAEDSIVQAVPEHPKRENVFCLSNSYGDVYLFQATNQTDLENWVTAIHSASASLLAKRQGKEDTVRLLRSQVRSLLQKIDMDGKMKKMAELQLTVVGDPKNRKAIENQIQQWEQNLERFNMDLFRMRCYLASLQGGELPNPKSLLAIASRPTKSTLGRLGIFSVSSFHALICSRDEAAVRRRSLSLTCRQRKKGLFSSLKGLDNLTKRGRDKRPSVSQVPLITQRQTYRILVSEVLPNGLAFSGGCGIRNKQPVGSQMCAYRAALSVIELSKSPLTPPVCRPLQSVDTVCTLYQSFQEGSNSRDGAAMDERKDSSARRGLDVGSGQTREAALLRPYPKHMSATERLRKVIQELVDTEKSYVKDLDCLFEIYLKPLERETFLTHDEMESLFGSLPEMLDFQRVFLQTLEERIASSPDFSTLETLSQFKKLLFSLGGSFLYYADHFKLYSGFCANHIKVQQVLKKAKTDQAFKEFLDARNHTKQHSSTLESYLIKPVQRVLKYPLLLRELVSLTDADSEEHHHLTEALKAMEKVASHINEMQKIYEDYGSVFDQLVAEQTGHDREITEISMGEFLVHSSLVWLNPHPSLGRMRKEPEITVFVFKKAVILVYRETNKLKKKMTNPRSALCHGEPDPFKFCWLIPLSALQVRLGNAAGESSCIWELVHSRSEVEGRPETVFQLCSRSEMKAGIVKVIRSILRENVRRNMKSEGPLEGRCKERLTPLHTTLPSSAKLGSSRAPWMCKQRTEETSSQGANLRLGLDSDDGSLSSGTYSISGAPPACTSSKARSTSVKESDILSDEDDDGFIEGGARRSSGESSSPTSAIEAQFLELKLSEKASSKRSPAPRVQPERVGDTPEVQPKLVRGHFSAVKRKGSGVRRSPQVLLHMKDQHRSLDSQTDPTSSTGVDLNSLLEREFSVQSLTSVVNEECFYDLHGRSG
uniref:TIAM Rac1 associated GEF 2a n=1 Tax=Oryzias sinensis TaxID=183150 RepID=A0A8C8DDE6_9TELE